MKYFFTSDTHFWHKNIIKYCHRPFLSTEDRAALESRGGRWHNGRWKEDNYRLSNESVEIMNAALIDEINAVVGADDVLWHLGDFSIQPHRRTEKALNKYYENCRFIRDKINCRNLNIVWGNHDGFDDLPDNKRIIRDLFNEAWSIKKLTVPQVNVPVILCHYAFSVWNKSHKKSINLYGHSHSGIEPWMNQIMPQRRSLDVGVDNAFQLLGKYSPFSMDEVMQHVGEGFGFQTNAQDE